MTILDDIQRAVDDIDDDLRRLVARRDAFATLLAIGSSVARHPVLDLDDVERQLNDALEWAAWTNALETLAATDPDTDPNPNPQGEHHATSH